MRFLTITLLALVGLAAAAPEDESLNAKWEEFKAKYNKKYSSPKEEIMRKMNFADTLVRLANLNSERSSAKFGITSFADYTKAEKDHMLGLKLPKDFKIPTSAKKSNATKVGGGSPIDWREKGAVLDKVKNQGNCGSCWAFACVGALESAWQIKTGTLVSLSEQDFLDCSGAGDCDGGNPFAAYENKARANSGIDTEDCYPYQEAQGSCKEDASCFTAFPTGIHVIQSEDELETYVSGTGPTIGLVAVDSGRGWFDYTDGVYTGPCGQESNHAVTIVGFTSDAWIIRNSWGDDWGNKGYMLLQKGTNMCDVESISLAPTV
jgi:C1A family cysteine protease